jgi:hypothetical protein
MRLGLFSLVLLVPALVAAETKPPAYEASFIVGPLKAQSLSKLTFGPDGILFIGDSLGARIFAVDVDDRTLVSDPGKLNVSDLEGKIGGMLGVDARDVLIHDMAVNPISKNIYLTASRGRHNFTVEWQLPNDVANASVLLRVTPSGEIQEVRLDKVKFSSASVSNPANEKVEIDWKKTKARVDAISDMAFANGKLFVAGLSNEEFASTMRVYDFPFTKNASSTSLEIYHGSHGKYETEAPVRAFLPIRINGKPALLASYLCTPLVVFPIDDLGDKKHVKGITIAELGDGNYPLDMVEFQFKNKKYVLIVNSKRGEILVNEDYLSRPLPNVTSQIEGTGGIPFDHPRSVGGVLHAGNYGEKNLVFLRRDGFNGELQLITREIDLP